MLARTFFCRRVLCVRDTTRKRNDAHDRSLLASASYDALREIHWYPYHHCLPVLPDLLFLTPRLQRLTVGALFDAECPIDDVVPECPQLPVDAAVLSAEVLSRIVACSAHTLRDPHLLMHGPEFDRLARMLPPLPALRTLALLKADGPGEQDPHGSDGVHIPRVVLAEPARALKVYATYRYRSLGAVQVFQRALEHWTRLRSLEPVVRAGHCNDRLEAALRRVCASKRIALRITRIYRLLLNWDAMSSVVPVGYGNRPLV
ncbi:hypothetical protein AURDEDRAFT_172466 [Auricularia subglabra TFB-10046 SS5]|nr:hypothetical protein AURDEDRAFT_172466 [Auricularia subglabra TFB-10046 SS5]